MSEDEVPVLQLTDLTYLGEPVQDDAAILNELPEDLRNGLTQVNGFIAFHGAFHLRGVGNVPEWHSLEAAWKGEHSIAKLFPAVDARDIPFGQDSVGNQYLLRDGKVLHLSAHWGKVEPLEIGLLEFLARTSQAPEGLFDAWVLTRFRKDGHTLEPGKLLNCYPPLWAKADPAALSIRAISALEHVRFLAHVARQISHLPDGAKVKFKGVNLPVNR
ncbi:hypothetical protein DRW03_16615 [Corallococcus sp. H22C18031201]|uniref:DUF2625 family protein n=1 Tax=Citreicoccus inhibens TaxID=2849499 RepID=UPI000E740B45|nr:DUF2625 family protein [Citreicoccus inhibens]MBU8896755.1 DUF2625 domain-containing protein [Citreicoccus inhibens]RJS21948.1 hypothetical protein DRW03_16615 [Corallococcus sp. H22C18031201]